MTHRWTALTIPLALLWCGLAFGQVGPHLEARWTGDSLVVTASEGTVYLVGGGRPDTYVGEGIIRLPASGVDAAYTPVGRAFLELRDVDGLVVVRFPIPERRWEVRLVLVVR
jgi:hypothetical protein